MIPVRRLFAAALVLALVLSLPLRLAMSRTGDVISAQAVEGTIWNGRLVGASLAGQSIGDLNARLSFGSLFLGKVRVRLDGPLLHGAVVASIGGRGGEITMLNMPIARSFGPVALSGLEISDARIRFRGDDCSEADGRVGLQLKTPFGEQRLSGMLRCNGAGLSAELVSQSAMQRLSLRFPDAGHYQATLAVRASDTQQATGLSAAGFRETPIGHVMKFSGAF